VRACESAQWVEGTRGVVCSLAGGGVLVLRTAPPPSASTLVLSARTPLAIERPSRRMSDHSNRTNRDVLHNLSCVRDADAGRGASCEATTKPRSRPAAYASTPAGGKGETGAGGSPEAAGAVPTARPAQAAHRLAGHWHLVTAGPRARAVAFGSRALFFFHVSWILPPRQIPARDPQVARPARTWSHSKTRPHVAWPGATRSDGQTRGWGAALNLI